MTKTKQNKDLRAILGRSMKPHNSIALWAVLAVSTCATAVVAEQEQQPLRLEARPVAALPQIDYRTELSDYRIGQQDLLEITVFGVDELSQTVRVADDGSISMPLLGRLQIGGLTKTEFENLLAGLLEERFLHDPQVSVFVREYESKRVAVSGSVKMPGTYQMMGRKTLLEMISMAGGLDGDMGEQIIIFRRNENGATDRLEVDLEKLVYAADPLLNLSVTAGDIIYVPAVEKIRIFVSGAVRNPNLYEVPRSDPVTVLKAITLAGGTTDRAANKRVQIMRTDDSGERVTLMVNLKRIKQGKDEDPILQADDIILVPEGFF
jgi:polysaccharide export outer membrane protein